MSWTFWESGEIKQGGLIAVDGETNEEQDGGRSSGITCVAELKKKGGCR